MSSEITKIKDYASSKRVQGLIESNSILANEEGPMSDSDSLENVIWIKHNTLYKKLNLLDIYFMEASEKLVKIYLYDRSIYFSSSLNSLLLQIERKFLVRVHRKFVVNLLRIHAIDLNNRELHIARGLSYHKLRIGPKFTNHLLGLIKRVRTG